MKLNNKPTHSMSPQEYLISVGIQPEKHVVIALIEDVLRNVSLESVLEGYAKAKGCEVCAQFPMEPYVFEIVDNKPTPIPPYVIQYHSTIF